MPAQDVADDLEQIHGDTSSARPTAWTVRRDYGPERS